MHHDDLLFAKKNRTFIIWYGINYSRLMSAITAYFDLSTATKRKSMYALFYSIGFKHFARFFSLFIQIHFKIGKYTKTEASIINEWIFFPFCWKRSCFLSRDLADLFDKKGNKKNKDNSPKNIPSAKINKQPYNDPNKYTFV